MDELITLLPAGLDKNPEVLETITKALDKDMRWRRRAFNEWNYVEEILTESMTPWMVYPKVLELRYLLIEWKEVEERKIRKFFNLLRHFTGMNDFKISFWLDSDTYPFVLPLVWQKILTGSRSFQGYTYIGSVTNVHVSSLNSFNSWKNRVQGLEKDLLEVKESLF